MRKCCTKPECGFIALRKAAQPLQPALCIRQLSMAGCDTERYRPPNPMTKKFRANDTWKRDGGRIVVTGNPGIGRYLFGVPWLLFGLHFYYKYLVLGTAEYIKAGDIAGIFTGVLGWLVIVLFGAVFVVPGGCSSFSAAGWWWTWCAAWWTR